MTSQKTLAPLSLNEMAQTILQKRYLAKDAQGRLRICFGALPKRLRR